MQGFEQINTLKLQPDKMAVLLLLSIILLLPLCHACPTNLCICEPNNKNQLIINCRSKILKTVPQWTPSNTEYAELTLGRNQITTLKNNAFAGLRIGKLDLSNNRINAIEDDAFLGLDATLYELVLHTHTMTVLPKTALSKLPNLRLLTLKNFMVASLPDNPFQYFKKLHTLQMDECGLTTLRKTDFNGINSILQSLNLPGNAFSSIPVQGLSVLTNLKVLNITFNANSFSEIPRNAFIQNTRLEHLDLTGNAITTISANAFSGLGSSLLQLVLHSNSLTDNQMSFMSGLSALEVLDLSTNKLTQIPTSLLQTLSVLKKLNLQNNNIDKLSRSSFDIRNSMLQELNIAENRMVEIEERTFEKLSKLEELNLDRQASPEILQSDTFKGIEDSLQTLLIQNNGLSDTHWLGVKYLRNLRNLHIGENRISTIPDGVFSQMNKLRVVDLHQNRISKLDHTKTVGLLGSIEVFDISTNHLATIGECTFYGFNLLEDIKLTGNPLHCDCKLRWLYDWMINKYDETIRKTLEWKCSGPARLQNRKFNTLSEQELGCSNTHRPLKCEDIVITPTGGPDPDSSQFRIINITNVTDTSFTVNWYNPESTYIVEFLVDLTRPDRLDIGSVDVRLSKLTTRYTVKNLEAETDYIVGVTLVADPDSGEKDQRHMRDVRTTKPKVAPVTGNNNMLKIILGAIFGVLAVILIIVIVCVICRCCRKRHIDEEDPYARPGQFRKKHKLATHGSLPTISGTTQRYSRSKTASMGTLQSAHSIDRLDFSPEERDRILNMLTNSGGTTMSMISNSSGAYIGPELPPRPAHLKQEYENNEQKSGPVYEEIGSDV